MCENFIAFRVLLTEYSGADIDNACYIQSDWKRHLKFKEPLIKKF